GLGRFLSVGQGSHEPPRFIVMRHRGRGGSGYDLGLVGKGITFDSGGISIKPADNMHHMKADMTGAASVIAALAAIGKLGLKVNVIGVAPCTENLPGGGATKPGDVFTAMSGKTVEVINTDAEGRLVLVDGITYAQREGAKRVIDVATLTGSIAVGLGQHFSGLFGKPDSFVAIVRETASAAGDRVWPMPLTDEYRDEVKGEVADIRNSTGARAGRRRARGGAAAGGRGVGSRVKRVSVGPSLSFEIACDDRAAEFPSWGASPRHSSGTPAGTAACRRAWGRPAPRGGRCRDREDPCPHRADRSPHHFGRGQAARDPRRHLHRARCGRDAGARRHQHADRAERRSDSHVPWIRR